MALIDTNAAALAALPTESTGSQLTAAATTPGAETKKIEVFDTAGSILGFIAVYDAIT